MGFLVTVGVGRGRRASGPRRLLRSTTRPDAGDHCGMCAPSRKHQRVCDGTRKSLPAAVKHSGAACNVLRVRRAGNVKYDVRNATYRVQHAKCHNTHACAHTETHTLTHRHTHSHRDTETQKRERHMHTGTQAHTDAHTPRCHVRSYQPNSQHAPSCLHAPSCQHAPLAARRAGLHYSPHSLFVCA